MEEVFKALADCTRRDILDRLFLEDGLTLGQICSPLNMSRQAVGKHLNILEEAGLVTVYRNGREKYHYLNRVPIRRLYDRWIDKYAEPRVAALTDLGRALEQGAGSMSTPDYVYQIFIKATPRAVWQGITSPEFTARYFHQTRIESDWQEGSEIVYRLPDDSLAVKGKLLRVDEPRSFTMTWSFQYDPVLKAEKPQVVTFEIEPMGELCKLTVTHAEFEDGSQTYEKISQGWGLILSSLKSLLETGEPLTFPEPQTEQA